MDAKIELGTSQQGPLPPRPQEVWDGTTLILNTALTFDPGDRSNGSLYLCLPPDSSPSAIASAVAVLRESSLWSLEMPKQVQDVQKPQYRDQLQFIRAVDVRVGGDLVILAQFNHPKYPSSSERFDAWINCLTAIGDKPESIDSLS